MWKLSAVVLMGMLAGVPLWAAGPFADVRILTENSPPGEMLDAKGRVTGPTAELVRELGRRLGVERDLEILPWTRGYALAVGGKRMAIFETTRTPERERLFQWVGPLKRIEWLFWAKKTSKFRPTTLDEVRKLGPSAVYLGDSKTDFLEANGFTDLTKLTRSEQSVKMLDSGRVATWMSSDLGVKEAFIEAGLSIDDFEPVFTVDTKYLYLAMTLDFTAAEVQTWRNAFEALKREGVLAKFYEGTYAPLLIRDLSRPGDPFVPAN